MFQTLVWNGGLCVMPGTHELPRCKQTGYQMELLGNHIFPLQQPNWSQQAAGNYTHSDLIISDSFPDT